MSVCHLHFAFLVWNDKAETKEYLKERREIFNQQFLVSRMWRRFDHQQLHIENLARVYTKLFPNFSFHGKQCIQKLDHMDGQQSQVDNKENLSKNYLNDSKYI